PGPARARRRDRRGELGGVGGPPVLPGRLSPQPAARRRHAVDARPLDRRRRVPHPARPPHSARPHPDLLTAALQPAQKGPAARRRVVPAAGAATTQMGLFQPPAVGPPALTRESSARPTTKNTPTATIAARWFPPMARETMPNTSGPRTAPVLPTSA